MPLNKLENFIKNTEGRILYVNPSDLDSTDAIENQGNSLTRPFKTIQRALLEAARFSWVKGNDNDIIEKTTILLMPGEHIIDNRPGFALKSVGGSAKVYSPGGSESAASDTLNLKLDSNFSPYVTGTRGTGHGVGLDVVEKPDLNKFSDFVFYPRMTLAIKLDLHELEEQGLRVEQVVEITEEGARPLNKLALKVSNDWAIL